MGNITISDAEFEWSFALVYNSTPGASASCPPESVKTSLIFTDERFLFVILCKKNITPVSSAHCDIQDHISSIVSHDCKFGFLPQESPGTIPQDAQGTHVQIIG